MRDAGQLHCRLSKLPSGDLHRRAIEYRRMALSACGEEAKSALDKLAIRYALLAARREVKEAQQPPVNGAHNQSELDKLLQRAEQAAVGEPDPVHALADAIRIIAAGDADPYLIMGVLVEGTIHLIERRIPGDRRAEAVEALLILVTNRLRSIGMLETR
jgi:hypothetical protein